MSSPQQGHPFEIFLHSCSESHLRGFLETLSANCKRFAMGNPFVQWNAPYEINMAHVPLPFDCPGSGPNNYATPHVETDL